MTEIDQAKAFMTYCQFAGDMPMTANVLQVDQSALDAIAVAHNWAGKVAELRRMNEGKDPKEQGIAINRGINFVQAQRCRTLVDILLDKLTTQKGDQLLELLTTTGPKGASFSTRPITDLVKAAAEAQLMTRLALGDVGSGELAEGSEKCSDIALSVMRAMNAATELRLPAAKIMRDQLP